MAGRTGTSVQKRQKELARAEKQREKFAKRLEKKREIATQDPEMANVEEVSEHPAGPESLA